MDVDGNEGLAGSVGLAGRAGFEGGMGLLPFSELSCLFCASFLRVSIPCVF